MVQRERKWKLVLVLPEVDATRHGAAGWACKSGRGAHCMTKSGIGPTKERCEKEGGLWMQR
jgi:hypothetical protein